ncbi:MAG: fructose-bisphosphate aldolase [Chloroflexi bacterium]|nr:fructose-bisphosphate aldolase [Chloroflexota bacterium]
MKNLHLRRIFAADGRTVIVAMDHTAYFGPMAGLERPGDVLQAVVEAGADAVLTTPGIAARFGDRLGRAGLILRADGGSSQRDPQPAGLRQIVSVERALRLGADALVCMGMIGFPDESASLRVLTDLADECSRWGLVVLAEMLVNGRDGNKPTAEDVAFAARVGADLGADFIKTFYVGPPDNYRVVTKSCYVPLVVLGGEKADDDRAVLESVASALEAGAAGVAIGRNVWQHANPVGMTRALVALVHNGATVDDALREVAR